MTDAATANVTDQTRADAIRACLVLKRKAQAAAGVYSKEVQRWKAAGVNPIALQAALKSRDKDPDEVIEVQRETIRMLAIMNIPTTPQDLFGDDISMPGKVVEEMSTMAAYDAGYLAGKAGRGIDDNPYNGSPGSAVYVQWREGWTEGQLLIASGPEAVKADTGRRPRAKKDAVE